MRYDLAKCYKIVKALKILALCTVNFTLIYIIILFSGDITVDVFLEILDSVLITIPTVLAFLFARAITDAVENDRVIIESNKPKPKQ
jgi:hypothetical protein